MAKLVLATLCAGVHPTRTLPVVLDCGTDVGALFWRLLNINNRLQNQKLLDDELYLGVKRPRMRGKEYDQFVDAFVKSARSCFPRAYIHL